MKPTPKTVRRSSISAASMAKPHRRKLEYVIDGNRVFEWSRIGWRDVGQVTAFDRARHPVVKG
jgi:hypothetical protein